MDLGSLAYITMNSKLEITAPCDAVDTGEDEDFVQDFHEAARMASDRAYEEHMDMVKEEDKSYDREYAVFDTARELWDGSVVQSAYGVRGVEKALQSVAPRTDTGEPSFEQLTYVFQSLVVREVIERVHKKRVFQSWPMLYDVVSTLEYFSSGGNKGPSRVAATTLLPPAKVLCEKCGFRVNPVGHVDRCKPVVAVDPVRKSMMRRLAWLGDAAHHSDVRRHLLLTGVPDQELEAEAQRYITQRAQAEYYDRVPWPEHPALGPSVEYRSMAFEANYYGSFRQGYLDVVLYGEGSYVIPPFLRVFFTGFPYGRDP